MSTLLVFVNICGIPYILSSFGLQISPKSCEQNSPYAYDNDLEGDIVQHPDLDTCSSPYRTRHTTRIVTILDHDADSRVELPGQLLRQQTQRNRARQVESQRNEEPADEEAPVIDCPRAEYCKSDEQPKAP